VKHDIGDVREDLTTGVRHFAILPQAVRRAPAVSTEPAILPHCANGTWHPVHQSSGRREVWQRQSTLVLDLRVPNVVNGTPVCRNSNGDAIT